MPHSAYVADMRRRRKSSCLLCTHSALETRLQDFGDASREVLFTCVCLNVGGLLLIVMHFVLNRKGGDSDESEDTTRAAGGPGLGDIFQPR